MATENRILCSCNGENPNCSKCAGMGYRNAQLLKLASQSQKTTPTPNRNLEPAFVRCPYCRSEVLALNINTHIRKIHNYSPLVKPNLPVDEPKKKCPNCKKDFLQSYLILHLNNCQSQNPTRLKGSRLKDVRQVERKPPVQSQLSTNSDLKELCPHCRKWMPKQSINSHVSNCVKQKVVTKPVLQPPIPSSESAPVSGQKNGGKGLLPCPYCPGIVLTKNLPKHINKVHRSKPLKKAPHPPSAKAGKRHVNILSPKSKTSGGKQVSTVSKRDLGQFGLADESNLDAKKYFGSTFRDQGRFGSYPSHDGFDDESEP